MPTLLHLAFSNAATTTSLLLAASLRAATLIALAIVVNSLLHRRSAAIRDRIWVLAFAGMLIMPAATLVIPSWRMATVTVAQPTSLPTTDVAFPDFASQRTEVTSIAVDEQTHQDEAPQADALLEQAATPSDGVVRTTPARRAPAARWPAIRSATIVATIWLGGVLVLLTRFITSALAMRAMISRARPLSDPAASQWLQRSLTKLELTRPVELRQADENTVPLTTGFFRPVILLPADWPSWPAQRLRFVLLHEVAHIKRHDLFVHCLARMACVTYWFNPLTWYAFARLRHDCELACDDLLLSAGEPAAEYATELIAIARAYRHCRSAAVVAMARSSKLESRIVSLLDRQRAHRPLNRRSSYLLAAVVTGLVFLFAGASIEKQSAVAADPPAQPQQPAEAPQTTIEPKTPAVEIPSGLAYRQGGKALLARHSGGLFFAASHQAVRHEIGLDDATAAKVQGLCEEYCQRLADGDLRGQRLMGDLSDNKDLDRDERAKTLRDQTAERDKKIKEQSEQSLSQLKALLTAEQAERLQQITRQIYGAESLIIDSALTKSLEISDEQLKKIRAMHRDDDLPRFQQERSGPSFADYQKANAERDAKIGEALTKEQQERFAQSKGAAFDLSRLVSPFPQPDFGWFGTNRGRLLIIGDHTVQQELGLNADEIAAVTKISRDFYVTWRDIGTFHARSIPKPDGPPHRVDEPAPRKWDFGEWRAANDKFLPELKATLTEQQFTRLTQINLQLRGSAALADRDVIQALGLTKEQQDKVEAITRGSMETAVQKSKEIRERPSFADLQKALKEAIDEHDRRTSDVLSPEQRAQWTELRGPDFDLSSLRVLNFLQSNPGRPAEANSQRSRMNILAPTYHGIFSTVKNDVVQKELGLTSDESSKIAVIIDEFSKAWFQVGGTFRIRMVRRGNGGFVQFQEAAMPPWMVMVTPGASEEEYRQQVQKKSEHWKTLTAQYEPRLKDLLNAEQYTRLRQINWQAAGWSALSEDDVIQSLMITSDQQAAIQSVDAAAVQKQREPNQDLDDEQLKQKVATVAADRESKLKQILTPAQLEQFVTMKGKEFDVRQLLDAERPGRGHGPFQLPPGTD